MSVCTQQRRTTSASDGPALWVVLAGADGCPRYPEDPDLVIEPKRLAVVVSRLWERDAEWRRGVQFGNRNRTGRPA